MLPTCLKSTVPSLPPVAINLNSWDSYQQEVPTEWEVYSSTGGAGALFQSIYPIVSFGS